MTKGINGDFDSDTILLTDNTKLIELARRHYNEFKVPTNLTSSLKLQRHYTTTNKTDLDIKTSVNKIGEIVNLSQQLNSLMWDRMNKGSSVESYNELYEDICKLAVLSNVEIDRAKKEFVINSATEIRILKEKYKILENNYPVKPKFFQMICLENGYKLSDNIKYKSFKTAMDYLQDIIGKYNFNKSRGQKKEVLPFISIVKKPDMNYAQGYYYKKTQEIIQYVRASKTEIKSLFVGYEEKDNDEKLATMQKVHDIQLDCISCIDAMSNVKAIMYLVLKELDNPNNKDIARYMFEVLFSKPNESFYDMIYESKEPIHTLIEDTEGDYMFYGIPFKKILISRNN